jgi:hypothetical protein
MKLIVAAALAAFVWSSGAAALTVHTAPFLAAATNLTGFETMTGGTTFEDDGMTVSYVGFVSDIWRTSQAAEGLQSWYPNGGGFGYTRIGFASAVDSFQFAAGSGWQTGTPSLQFQLLLGGDLVAQGVIEGLPNFTGFSVYGFSDARFDEVRLQGQIVDDGQFSRSAGPLAPPEFDEGALDGLTLDALAFGGPIDPPGAIPEPTSWALLISGFGLVGAALRRKRALEVA